MLVVAVVGVLTALLAVLLAIGGPANLSVKTVYAAGDYTNRTATELETIVGPIALYPDVLLGSFLPAVTYMDQCVLAHKFINDQKGKVEDIDKQTWDDVVKSVAHYPELLQIINDNLDWAAELGDVFIHQQENHEPFSKCE
jgi:hypothetical protein